MCRANVSPAATPPLAALLGDIAGLAAETAAVIIGPADLGPAPDWFTGPAPRPDPYTRACPRCGAPAGERCRYTARCGNIHRDPATGAYVPNVLGEPTLRAHAERYRP